MKYIYNSSKRTRFSLIFLTYYPNSYTQVTGAIFISSEIDLIESGRFACPGVLISPKDKRALIRYAQRTEHPKASIKFQQTFAGTKPSPAVASFSSRGPSRVNPFIIKPDILAPGTRILAATVPTVISALIGTNIELPSHYDLKSGTSMSCPHVSGVAAMIKSVHPKWSPAVVKSAMMTTANPLDNTGKPITDNGDESRPASAVAMGSGHIDPNRALDPGLVYDIRPQEYVNFLCAMNYTDEQIKTITRSKANDCSKASLDLNYPSFFVLCVNADASGAVKLRRVVTNVANGPATYRVSVKTPKNTTVTVFPQKLVFGKKDDKQNYTVSVRCKTSDIYMFGELVWIEENGKHRVRSPIAVSPFPIDLDQ